MSDRIYGLDLETDNNGNEAWIVQWVLHDGKHGKAGTELSDLSTILQSFLYVQRTTYVYAHNATYDLNFLRPVFHEMETDARNSVRYTMRQGRIIEILVQRGKRAKLKFRDSMAKIPGSLKKLGKMIGLPKLEGVSEDFSPGWSEKVDLSDRKEWDYVIRDAEIVAVAMHRMHKAGRKKATASGDAYKTAKDFIAGGHDYKRNLKWEWLFPQLPMDVDAHLRPAYFGGVNLSPPVHHGRTEGPITHVDVHSMYPSVMSFDPLPYGIPTFSLRKPRDGALYIAEVRVRFHLKDEMVPWLQFKMAIDNQMEGISQGDTIEETYQFHDMMLTNIDLETIGMFYDIEYDPEYPIIYWIFKQKVGVFKGYIEECMARKEKAEKGSLEYQSAKLDMNSLYGRFALAPDTEEVSLEWDEDMEDYVFRTSRALSEDMENYLPYAIFVTAQARRRLLTGVHSVGCERVIHCDTDSIIFMGEDTKDLDVGDHLGQWGIESRPKWIVEGGFKRYFECMSETLQSVKDISIACAGVPQPWGTDAHGGDYPKGMWIEILDNPNLIYHGQVLGDPHYHVKSEWLRKLLKEHGADPDDVNTMKLIPVKVKGGIILEQRQHKLDSGMQYRIRGFFK